MASTILSTIVFIASHAGPADHFSTFAEKLVHHQHPVEAYASGPAIQKFKDRAISVSTFDAEDRNYAEVIAKNCKDAVVVLTDVGHPFALHMQRALAVLAPNALRMAYYDNPESYVPGGYSWIAVDVMQASQRVLFANANLADTPIYREPEVAIDLSSQERIGLGFYPVSQADRIALRRVNEKEILRSALLEKHQLPDEGQKVCVYFGGANDVYFESAFPAFLEFLKGAILLTDLSNLLIVLQQHPSAKAKNIDVGQAILWIHEHGNDPHAPKIIFSSDSTETMQVIADTALYHQTSMGPLFALAGIPMIQVGHEVFDDAIVRSNLCLTATNSEDLAVALKTTAPVEVTQEVRGQIYQSLGIRDTWYETLTESFSVPIN